MGYVKLEMTDHHARDLFTVAVPVRINLASLGGVYAACVCLSGGVSRERETFACVYAGALSPLHEGSRRRARRREPLGAATRSRASLSLSPTERASHLFFCRSLVSASRRREERERERETPRRALLLPPPSSLRLPLHQRSTRHPLGARAQLAEAKSHIDEAVRASEEHDLEVRWRVKSLFWRAKARLRMGMYDDARDASRPRDCTSLCDKGKRSSSLCVVEFASPPACARGRPSCSRVRT